MALFDKKKKGGGEGDRAKGGEVSARQSDLQKNSEDHLKQARAILLEANITGADVRDAQELFKKALHEHESGEYAQSLEHSIECIDLVDEIMKTG